MPNYAVARMAKQKGGSVGSCGHHNDRTRTTINADPDRKGLNRVLIGDDRNVREIVSEVIEAHGGKPRRDSVEALELVLTATREHFTDAHGEIVQEKVDRFLERAVAFLEDPRSGGICVKAVLHLDERTPHVQAHKVPITPEGKLSCKYYFGEKRQWVEFQDLYYEYMKELGLERGERGSFAQYTDIQKFYTAITGDHRLRLDLDQLPDPPKVAVTKDSIRKYKQEIVSSVNEQTREPLKTLHHQAMLTREEVSKREAAERHAAERVIGAERRVQFAEERLRVEERVAES